jgi:predicted nucleic acid-binding protein
MRNSSSILLLQSLAEFSNVATRKLGISTHSVRRRVTAWGNVLPVQAAMKEDVVSALEIVRRYHLAFWDALMCATAMRVGIRYLLTEDLHDGLALDGMTIVNPFAARTTGLIDRILPR